MHTPDPTVPLPAPSREALAHQHALSASIRTAIAVAGGAIPFDRYMQMCLYTPGLGYYMAGSAKFGPAGDFTTAPEISPLFAQGLAMQIGQALDQLGPVAIVEFGAGSGRLAADLLASLSRANRLPACYAIVEPSADLRERQHRLLAHEQPALLACVRWWETLPDAPIEAIVIANEVLDALPVQVFQVEDDGIVELGVGEQGGNFTWCIRPAGPALLADFARLKSALPFELQIGYRSEISGWIGPWLAAIAQMLARGLVLLCDYGYPRHEYYHPDRATGTLICHYRQRAHADPFFLPGLQDISASVDFTHLAELADGAGFELAGYTTQAGFLLATGLADAFTTAVSDAAGARQAAAARRLLLPGEMGEKFKFVALTRGCAPRLRGFETLDLRHRLLPAVSL